MLLPEPFIQRIQEVFPLQAQNIITAIKKGSYTKSFRINPNKITQEELQDLFIDSSLQVSNIGKYIFTTEQKSLYTKNPLIFSGAYYFQDLASMLPVLVLDVQPSDFVLDSCASPGSKSTHILSFLGKTGKLLTNEITKTRVGRLIENIARWGTSNVFICSQDTKHFSSLNQIFDKILVDAPCSGEGMFYKNEDSIQEWSPRLVQKCASLQKQILDNLFPSLKVGGELVYSTCTLSVEENEEVIDYILKKYKGCIELVDFSSLWDGGENALSQYQDKVFTQEVSKYTRRIFPYHQDFNGEAFFVAKFRLLAPLQAKESPKNLRYQNHWDIPKKTVQTYLKTMGLSHIQSDDIFALGHFLYTQKVWNKQDLKQLISLLHPVYVGCRLGTLKKDWIEPANESATSIYSYFSQDMIIDLNIQEIEKYVMAEPQILEYKDKIVGFKVITYCNKPIGFGKLMPDGILKSFFKPSQGKKVFST